MEHHKTILFNNGYKASYLPSPQNQQTSIPIALWYVPHIKNGQKSDIKTFFSPTISSFIPCPNTTLNSCNVYSIP